VTYLWHHVAAGPSIQINGSFSGVSAKQVDPGFSSPGERQGFFNLVCMTCVISNHTNFCVRKLVLETSENRDTYC
jgi:hypothetical protein